MTNLLKAVLGTALLLGIFQSGYSVRLEVKDSTNVTCILADLDIDFKVDYKKSDGKQGVGSFQLPNTTAVDKTSSCGKDAAVPLLNVTFGSGYFLSMNFTKTDKEYHIDILSFTYNLSDVTNFPDSAENGTKQVSSSKAEISALTNQSYKCLNPHLIVMGNVNATFHNVKMEAYLSGGNYSTNVTTCKEDITPTSPPTPTTRPTPAPTTPPVTKPQSGDYKVKGPSESLCLWASMGLQLNISYLNKAEKNVSNLFNIDPKKVNSTGNCSKDYAYLQIFSEDVSLLLNFTLNATDGSFFLRQVHLNMNVLDAKDPKFIADNGSLLYLHTTKHKTYKCNKEQNLQITDRFTINTFDLQVQVFDVDGKKFGPAQECAADQDGMLVPIIVGAALAGLVLIVLIAYLIGRKRSHAGYQTI